MIVLNDNDVEVGIYPGNCIKAKSHNERHGGRLDS